MWLRKTDPPETEDAADAVDVVVELRDELDRDEVMQSLVDLGVPKVKELSGNFLSARMTRDQIEAVRERADVQVKRESRMHEPPRGG